MKKNIILGVSLFLLITAFCSALYFIVVVDENAKKNEELLKAQEIEAKAALEGESKNSVWSNNNNIETEKEIDATKEEALNGENIINIENKDDAQKVLEEAIEITEAMDDITF